MPTPEMYKTRAITIHRLERCGRCTGTHENLEAREFKDPPETGHARHWAICPTTNEPILVEVTEVAAEESTP